MTDPSDPDFKEDVNSDASSPELDQISQPESQDGNWMRFAGMGIELASYTLSIAGVGYLIDQSRGHVRPVCTALGTLIGFSFGMFRFIQRVSNKERIDGK